MTRTRILTDAIAAAALATASGGTYLVATSGDVVEVVEPAGQVKIAYLSSYPRKDGEATDLPRITRWLEDPATRGSVERVDGGLWLHHCAWWSVRMPRAGSLPLRVTGKSWRTKIEWLLGGGSLYGEYSPVQLGYYTHRSGERRDVPAEWLVGFDEGAWYSSSIASSYKPAIVRVDFQPEQPTE